MIATRGTATAGDRTGPGAGHAAPAWTPASLDARLLDAGFSPDDLAEARRQCRAGRTGLVAALLKRNVLKEPELLDLVGAHFGLPVWTDLPIDHVDTEFTKKIPIHFLRKYHIVPLGNAEGLVVAVHDPSDFQPLDDVCRLLGRRDRKVVLAPQDAILTAINFIYDLSSNTAQQFFQEMTEESPDSIISAIEDRGDLLDETSDAPIIKLVNLMLSGAVRDRASDIHIEPYQNATKIRYRIDGILYDTLSLPRRVQSPLVSRIKVMAKLNIAEKRLPQDGRIEIKIGDKSVDIRVSVIPTAFGERVVLRLLDKTGTMLRLFDLGMNNATIRLFEKLIKSPYGIVLVTGPTGSGKTTTLYAALSTINHPEINIITIEDPIEYQIEGIGQIQVNARIGMTFASGLRSIVRQDPDVILVGEIRDRETAEIAIQSSLTGHLVFSTLHTNDAASAITRLIEMEIEPFLVTSSVIAIIAQRLVRVLCPRCKEAYTPDEESLANLGIDPRMLAERTIYQRKGCLSCMNTGYRGRTAIFEVLIVDDAIKNLVLKTSDANLINEAAVQRGMTTMSSDGVQKVLDGVTTIEEVLRVTRILKRDVDIELIHEAHAEATGDAP
jgi:general secretion pathway protein E